MMMENSNPLAGSFIGKDTLFDKLNQLADEIIAGIINISDARKEDVMIEIDNLRMESFKERCPEAVFSTILFRKYADIANRIKDSRKDSPVESNLWVDIPSFSSASFDEDSSGWASIRRKSFILRISATLFGFLTFIVMSVVEHIDLADYNPGKYFSVRYEYIK
jgi:hypothetical protein